MCGSEKLYRCVSASCVVNSRQKKIRKTTEQMYAISARRARVMVRNKTHLCGADVKHQTRGLPFRSTPLVHSAI